MDDVDNRFFALINDEIRLIDADFINAYETDDGYVVECIDYYNRHQEIKCTDYCPANADEKRLYYFLRMVSDQPL